MGTGDFSKFISVLFYIIFENNNSLSHSSF